jgi:hypothetical protein
MMICLARALGARWRHLFQAQQPLRASPDGVRAVMLFVLLGFGFALLVC